MLDIILGLEIRLELPQSQGCLSLGFQQRFLQDMLPQGLIEKRAAAAGTIFDRFLRHVGSVDHLVDR